MKRARQAKGPTERDLRGRLSACLTDDEIRHVAARALVEMNAPDRNRVLASLGKETERTVSALLATPVPGDQATQPPAGKAKLRQEWEQAWSDWDEVIAESGREHGKYVLQEHHWEEPYLDVSALAEDLEPIAARMRKLIPQVIEQGLDPDFSFAEALKETVEDIGGGLPEWMDGALDDGCPFGPQATRCLLDWEWMTVQNAGKGAFDFIDGICTLEHSSKGMGLDDEGIADFVLDQSDRDQKIVLDGMSKNRTAAHWAAALGSAHSGWFHIYQELSRRWEPGRYLESCRASIQEDWTLALPVLSELVRKKAFREARSVVDQALRALLHLKEGESWDPSRTLLIRRPAFRYGDRWNREVARLLDSWKKIALGLGNEELAQAILIQEVLFSKWADGETALDAFRRISHPGLRNLHRSLFADWRAMVAEETLGRQDEEQAPGSAIWVLALVDAAGAGSRGPSMFRRALRKWLDTLKKPASFERNTRALDRLTLDMEACSLRMKTPPKLRKLLLHEEEEGDRVLKETRRRWLQRLGAGALFPEVIRLWRRQASRLPPNPAASAYEACAEWLAAVEELDPAASRKVLREWGVAHRRRRNLWKAVAKRGFRLGQGGKLT